MNSIKGLTFMRTSITCPEQYDVILNKGATIVGYVRLRFGELKCEYPNQGGEIIYRVNIGNNLTGSFESEEQRKYHFKIIANKILEKLIDEISTTDTMKKFKETIDKLNKLKNKEELIKDDFIKSTYNLSECFHYMLDSALESTKSKNYCLLGKDCCTESYAKILKEMGFNVEPVIDSGTAPCGYYISW